MFYAYPSRMLLTPSAFTKAFRGADGKGTITGKLHGGIIGNFMPIPELSATGTDYLYDLYNIVDGESYYSVMTPNVNPYIMVVCPGADTSAYSIFEPMNVPFNGDTIWRFKDANHDLDAAIKATMVAKDPQMPAKLSSYIAQLLLPCNGYFSLQRGKYNGNEYMALTWTKYIADFYLGFSENDSFQYLWDTQTFKDAYEAEISAHNQEISWENYVPSLPVWHQPVGARGAMFTKNVSVVDPMGSGSLNSDAMVFEQLPNEFNMDFQMTAYFFYPLMYLDENFTGEFTKLSPSEGFPNYTNFSFRKDNSTGPSYALNSEIENGVETKKYGTPVWQVTFNNVPFSADVDPDRNYYVAFANDGGVLTANISNADQAREYYYNRPTIKNYVMFWSEAKSDILSGEYGKDTRIENFLSCAFTQLRGTDTSHTNRFIFDSISFRSIAYEAVWKTEGCPKRGQNITATEEIPENQEYTPKGGTITLHWRGNVMSTLTNFFVKDEQSYREQILLDGIDMTMGVFQILETKYEPTTT